MESEQKKKPNYLVSGLISVLVAAFVISQWMVVHTIDARLAEAESKITNVVVNAAAQDDDFPRRRGKKARAAKAEQAAAAAAAPAPAPAAPSGAPAPAQPPVARK